MTATPSPEPATGERPDAQDDDPLAGIPEELIEAVGAYDHDTAGGCG